MWVAFLNILADLLVPVRPLPWLTELSESSMHVGFQKIDTFLGYQDKREVVKIETLTVVQVGFILGAEPFRISNWVLLNSQALLLAPSDIF